MDMVRQQAVLRVLATLLEEGVLISYRVWHEPAGEDAGTRYNRASLVLQESGDYARVARELGTQGVTELIAGYGGPQCMPTRSRLSMELG